ncbi:MAG: hypothetical protein WCE62_01675 [Polyangiales bacterium]
MPAIGANLILCGFFGAFAWLEASHPDLYYRSVQEDQALEWASFWSFLIAGVLFVLAARNQRRKTGALPWFLAALVLFCFFVAMEEVSWGQRIFGQLPPEYFLSENYQQELNVHNLASTKFRLFAFRAVILGYGVLLPVLGSVPFVGRLLDRSAVVPPPVALIPSMLAMFVIHVWYPWKFTGEVVETALGLGFLFAAAMNAAQYSNGRAQGSFRRETSLVILVAALAFATAWWSQNRFSQDPANLQLANAEINALRSDLIAAALDSRGETITNCGLHKRMYTFVFGNARALPLKEGAFKALVERGLPDARAEFFLDPWGSPYWIRDRCDRSEGRRVVFVYSFGPNRRRDSNRWEILGDDVGRFVLVKP